MKTRFHADEKTLLVQEMVDAGELRPYGDDLYEDVAGHLLSYSHIDYYLETYLNALPKKERDEILKRVDEKLRM